MPGFDKATYLSHLLKFILSERLSNSQWGSEIVLISEFIDIVFILFWVVNILNPYWIHIFYTFLVISFSQYQEYIICLI